MHRVEDDACAKKRTESGYVDLRTDLVFRNTGVRATWGIAPKERERDPMKKFYFRAIVEWY